MPSTAAALNRWIIAGAVAAAALVLAAQLLVPPVVGLADNGDYQRVMGYAGFEHSTDSYAERCAHGRGEKSFAEHHMSPSI